MNTMAIDWTEICAKYAGLWVGLQDDERTVIASGATVREVMEAVEKRGYEKPILFKVPAEVVPYVGGFGV